MENLVGYVTTVTRRFEWDAGHRVLGHGGPCRFLHGHRYRADVTVSAPALNDLGMVADFADLKAVVGSFIGANWDHNIILHPEDPLAILYQNMGDTTVGLADAITNDIMGSMGPVFGGRVPYVMPKHLGNPTAENLAELLAGEAEKLLPGLAVVRVRVYETPNCWADYRPLPPGLQAPQTR